MKCINCHQRRSCVLVEASIEVKSRTHDDKEWEVQARVPICRKCLRDDIGALGHYLAEELK